jgi:hypothetical protein
MDICPEPLKPKMTSLTQEIHNDDRWTFVCLRTDAPDFTPEDLGSAHWRNYHDDEKYVFYTPNMDNTWNPVEYINDKWYSLTYDTSDMNFYVKETDALEVFDPRHPKYKTTMKAREPEASGLGHGTG